ncbi:MAG: hypothetical protein D6E12_04925 [Desulfovibrio sp.]|nr:MAG: hypothetical protein D6E12_04925 [Desulfovibrio sp.]
MTTHTPSTNSLIRFAALVAALTLLSIMASPAWPQSGEFYLNDGGLGFVFHGDHPGEVHVDPHGGAHGGYDPHDPHSGGVQHHFMPDVDLPGMDFHEFPAMSNDPVECFDACVHDPGCRAYTFVRPGIQGPHAHCWLKHDVPHAVPNGGMDSGIVR